MLWCCPLCMHLLAGTQPPLSRHHEVPEASPPQNREQALDHTPGRPTNPPHAKVSVYDMALCVPGLSACFRQGETSRRARLARIPELSSNKRVQVARASADVETVDKYTQLGASGLRVSKVSTIMMRSTSTRTHQEFIEHSMSDRFLIWSVEL